MTNKKEKPIVLFPINANPPNLSHIMAINTLLDMAQKIIVIVYDNPQILAIDTSIDILSGILSQYKNSNKIVIVKSPVNFATLSEMPDDLKIPKKAFTIATTSRHVYANLRSKGYPYLIFIKKPSGWRDEFYAIAFMRSISLHNIEVMNIEAERRNMYGRKK